MNFNSTQTRPKQLGSSVSTDKGDSSVLPKSTTCKRISGVISTLFLVVIIFHHLTKKVFVNRGREGETVEITISESRGKWEFTSKEKKRFCPQTGHSNEINLFEPFYKQSRIQAEKISSPNFKTDRKSVMGVISLNCHT